MSPTTPSLEPAVLERPPLKMVLRRGLPMVASLGVLGAVVSVNALLQPNLLTLPVLRSNLATFLPLIAAAIGQAVVVIAGGIDLSAGGIITLVNVVVVTLTGLWGAGDAWSTLAVVAAGLAVSVAAGLLNGLLVAYLRLQALVATFATNFIWMGLTLYILPVPGGSAPESLYRFYRASVLGVPTVALITLGLFAIWAWLKGTRFGRYLYAVGGNADAAFASGVAVQSTRLWSYALGALFFGFSGVLLTADIASGDPLVGTPLTLSSVAAVVIGGTPLSGGSGGAGGAIIGAVILGLIRNIIFFADVSPFFQDFISGVIVIVALALAAILPVRRRPV